MFKTPVSVVILAAGKGTRMRSRLPKVLHKLAGIPIVEHVVNTVTKLGVDHIHLVHGYGGEQLQAELATKPIHWVLQTEQLGTGHAVQQVMPYLADHEDVLILYGDVPLITVETLHKLLQSKPAGGIGLLTVMLDDPHGYGRIIRQADQVVNIVEQQDADAQQLKIREINTGILVAQGGDLKRWLVQLTQDNKQKEYYLTDIIAIAHNEGKSINTVHPLKQSEVEGINTRQQLAILERVYQQEQADKLLLAGVTLLDPHRFDLRGEFTHGKDVIIDTNVILEGQVIVGDGVKIGAGCILKECIIGDDCVINPYSVLSHTTLASGCSVGPFAHLRPGSQLAEGAHVGNFVEMKKASLGKGSKAGHLSYLGDSVVGNNVNIGAGTITCNYDGANKHQTIIGDDVFVGSDSQLIAPVTVARGATIAAGTTVTNDIAENELVLSRVKQIHINGWQRPVKNKK